MSESEPERRLHPRFLCSGVAEVRSLASGIVMRGRIANLSLRGCLIQPKQGSWLRRHESVEMTFAVRQLPLRVQGLVCLIHADRGVGVHFTLLSERGKRQLQELIEELEDILHDQRVQLINQARRKK